MSHADILDEAAEREQQLIAVALANRPLPQMTYTGECHYCEEPIDKGHFCSDECRADHERMVWAEKQRAVA
nr:MAG TPA_asm: DNA-directed RNA polymerase subunit alpha [Caudoviricetes sp.]